MDGFRGHRGFSAPWNRRLSYAFNKNPLPVWVEDDDIDLEYHVRHAALPWPGGERELGELVGRLQSTPLDLSRPPWECTIIEGLEDDRFALFIKMHHSLIDGVSGMKLLQRAMSTDRRRASRCRRSGSAPEGTPAHAGRSAPAPTIGQRPRPRRSQALRGQVRSLPQLVAAFGKILRRVGDPAKAWWCPSTRRGRCSTAACARSAASPPSSLRWSACARWPTPPTARSTTSCWRICGGALRRFLLERDSLPDKSLTAGIPVSVRPEGRRGHRQRDHLHRRHAGHRHRRPGRAPAGHPRVGAAMPRRTCRACRARR